jgi:hypothetical protein
VSESEKYEIRNGDLIGSESESDSSGLENKRVPPTSMTPNVAAGKEEIAETPPKKKRRICVFRDEWLKESQFKSWLERDTDSSLARCRVAAVHFLLKLMDLLPS